MPQLSASVFRQGPNERLADIPRHGDGPTRVRLTHILNPYPARSDDGRAVQEMTFETIRIAARMAAPSVAVRCVCVTLPDEANVVPPDFITAPLLTRTVLDIASFDTPRALPLVFDILGNGLAVPEDPPAIPGCDDFLIFTNVDIHLQPHFYLAVVELIKAGYDSIDIHRRTIQRHPASLSELPLLFGEMGLHHGGSDCFVFPRHIYNAFVTNHACVGRSFVMRAVVFNLALQARRFLIVDSARLTFHIGDDRVWADPRFKDYTDFNFAESNRVLRAMAQDKQAARKVLASLQAIGARPDFLRTIEAASGLVRTRPALHRLVWRKLKGAHRRLIQAITTTLSRWEV